jgi:hypothetical protein
MAKNKQNGSLAAKGRSKKTSRNDKKRQKGIEVYIPGKLGGGKSKRQTRQVKANLGFIKRS